MWEMREIGKGEKQEAERLTQRLTEVGQQLKMDAKLLEQRVDQLQSGQSPEDLRQRIESVRTDQNRKLKSMYEALEEMGNLQASLVDRREGWIFIPLPDRVSGAVGGSSESVAR